MGHKRGRVGNGGDELETTKSGCEEDRTLTVHLQDPPRRSSLPTTTMQDPRRPIPPSQQARHRQMVQDPIRGYRPIDASPHLRIFEQYHAMYDTTTYRPKTARLEE